MAGGKVAPAGRARSHASYYAVLAAILALLAVLCAYACYFFISRIKELSGSDAPSTAPCALASKKAQTSYPVQPVVRDSATAMAALCRQLPPGHPQGGQVHPAGTSPDPRPAHHTPSPLDPRLSIAVPDKSPEIPAVPCIAVEAAR